MWVEHTIPTGPWGGNDTYMTKRSAMLLFGLAAMLVGLLSTDWHPLRAVLFLLGWIGVAVLLVWGDKHIHTRPGDPPA